MSQPYIFPVSNGWGENFPLCSPHEKNIRLAHKTMLTLAVAELSVSAGRNKW